MVRQVVVDLAVVHPRDICRWNRPIVNHFWKDLLAFPFDPVVLRVDEHAVHVEEYGGHARTIAGRKL
jgi:hypothetical protein